MNLSDYESAVRVFLDWLDANDCYVVETRRDDRGSYQTVPEKKGILDRFTRDLRASAQVKPQ